MDIIRSIGTIFYNHLDDAELMEKVCGSNDQAFAVIFNRYKIPIFNYILRTVGDKPVAEELTQESFLKLFRARSTFNPSKNLRSWLFTIARNSSYDFLRKKQNVSIESQFNDEQDRFENIELEGAEVWQELIDKAEKEILYRAIDNLPLSQKDALLLWIGEQSYKDISLIMDKSEQAIKNLVNRARNGLLLSLKERSL